MSDYLKLSDPSGKNVDDLNKISSALEKADNEKRIHALEKNIADLKKLQADKDAGTQSKSQASGSNKIGARHNSNFKAVSTAPSINKTPMGNSTPPLPYPTSKDLSNSVSTVPTVKFNGDPAYVLDQTTQPSCSGDDAGTAKGVKSGTVNGEVKPVAGSTTVRAGKKQIVREGDPCTMNGGNNPGIYLTTQTPTSASPSSAVATSNPPAKPETAQEKSAIAKWWDNAKSEMGEAVDHPWEGIKGAAKGIANIPSDVLEILLKGSVMQSAGDMEQAAAMQSVFGQAEASEKLFESAAQVRESAGAIDVPKFSMANKAQSGGDKISTIVQLLAGGEGLVKSGVGALGTLGKVGKAAEAAGAVGKTTEAVKTTEAIVDAGKMEAEAAAAGDGVKVVPEPKPKIRKQNKPRQPREFEKKVINEDGSVTYTLKNKSGEPFEITYRDGYPDFSKYKYDGSLGKAEVKIEMTGNNSIDFQRANEKAGFGNKASSTPDNFTWHHNEDGTTMQLIRSDVHSATPHTGGASIARSGGK